MAILTLDPVIATTAYSPFEARYKNAGVVYRRFSGTGTTITPVQAAPGAGYRIRVLGLSFDADAAEVLNVMSGAGGTTSVIHPVRTVMAGTVQPKWVDLPLEMKTNEELNIKLTNGAGVTGIIYFQTVADGAANLAKIP